jgi:hypothetical protein
MTDVPWPLAHEISIEPMTKPETSFLAACDSWSSGHGRSLVLS